MILHLNWNNVHSPIHTLLNLHATISLDNSFDNIFIFKDSIYQYQLVV